MLEIHSDIIKQDKNRINKNKDKNIKNHNKQINMTLYKQKIYTINNK